MLYDVLIRVRGEQYYEGIDPDATELNTKGALERCGEGWRLRYEEDAASDMAGTRTEFLVSADTITLTRSGALRSEMRFSPKEPHKSLYETPYGSLTMEIVTEQMEAQLGECGGTIDITYTIAVDRQQMGKNRFHIEVTTIDRG